MTKDIDKLLCGSIPPPAPTDVQDRWVQQGVATLRQSRRQRLVLQSLGSWCLIALGAGFTWLILPVPPHAITSQPTVPAMQPPLLTAAQLELEAEKADEAPKSARLYREAGDRYLAAQDIASALRCYRLHLTEGGQAVRPILTSDSWLLMNLKNQPN